MRKKKSNKGSNNERDDIPLHRTPSPFPRSHDTNDRQPQDSPRVKFSPEDTHGDKDSSRPSSSESHWDGVERSRTTDPDIRPSSSESHSTRGKKPPVSYQQHHHHNKPVLKSWTKDYHRRQGGSGVSSSSRSRSSSITRSRRTKDPSPQPQERPDVRHARDHISSMVNSRHHGDSWDDDRDRGNGRERERSHSHKPHGGGSSGQSSRKSFQKVSSLSMMTEGERRDNEKKVQHVHDQHEHEIAHWPQQQPQQPQRDGLLSQVERHSRKKETSRGRRRMSKSPGKFIRKLGKKIY